MDTHKLLTAALEAAREAGTIIRHYAGRAVEIQHKAPVDLVTEVDLACEKVIRDTLGRHAPSIPVLGEEQGIERDADIRWVVDPLDGTTNFVHGFPMYAVSIALESGGDPQVGVVYDPVRDRMYHATRGGGASCNRKPIRVSNRFDLGSCLIATGFAYDRRERVDFYLAHMRAVMLACRGVRRAGAAALDLALVAEGRVDGFWEFNLRPWDVAAGRLLVEEAGGRVDPLPGCALEGDWPSPVATNGLMHEALIRVLDEATKETQ